MNASAAAASQPRPRLDARGDRPRRHARAVRRAVAGAQAGPGDIGRPRQPRRHGRAHLHAQPVRAAPLLRARSPKRASTARISPCWSAAASRPRHACSPPPAASTRIAARSSCSACCAPRRAPSRASTAAHRIRRSCAMRCAGTGAMRWPAQPARAHAARRHRRATPRPAQRVRRGGAGFPGAVRDGAARADGGAGPRPDAAAGAARHLVPHHGRAGRQQSRAPRRPRRTAPRAARCAAVPGSQAASRGPTGFSRRRPLPTTSWRGACRPAARQTRSPRPAGSRACVAGS